jgi:adenosylcobinamide-phosphate synthase
MAAGAGALGLRLGGGAIYHGQWEDRPALGDGAAPKAEDILRAADLVQRGLWLWLVVFGLVAALLEVLA